MTSRQVPEPVSGPEMFLAAILGVLSDIRDRLPEREVPVPVELGPRVVELVEPAVPVEVRGQASLLEPEVPKPAPTSKRTRVRDRG